MKTDRLKLKKMRPIIILFCTIAVLCASCNNSEDEITNTIQTTLSRSSVIYSGDVEGVSVLIFGFFNNDYYYQKSLNSGWIDNRISTNLELGKYKFLYYKASGSKVDILPISLTSSTTFGAIQFQAKDDTGFGADYVLPVEEIWLPETPEMANKIHTISGNDLIENTLKRAVSQVELHVMRGELANEKYTPIPFVDEDNIMNYISEIRLDISGVGKTLNYAGTTGC